MSNHDTKDCRKNNRGLGFAQNRRQTDNNRLPQSGSGISPSRGTGNAPGQGRRDNSFSGFGGASGSSSRGGNRSGRGGLLSTPALPRISPEDLKIRNAAKQEKTEAREKNLIRWKNAERKFPPFETAGIAADGLQIKSNFFKITLDEKVQLFRYRVEFDAVNGRRPTNKRTRRYLMRSLLGEESTPSSPSPSHKSWISDWHTYIISVGKLYGGNETYIRHHRSAPKSGTILMNSVVTNEGLVDFAALQKLVVRQTEPSSPRQADYHPGQDLLSLNIIFAKDINTDEWNGTRVGKKFFPDDTNLSRNIRQLLNTDEDVSKPTGPIICEAKTGFFCSTRPGDGSVLLNVSTTTAAFFPPINLQAYIETRFSSWKGTCKIPPTDEVDEFRGLTVTRELQRDGEPDAQSSYRIRDCSTYSVSQESSPADETLSVFQTTLASKFISIKKFRKLTMSKSTVKVLGTRQLRTSMKEHVALI